MHPRDPDDRPLILGVAPRGLARTQAESLARSLAERKSRFPIHLEIIGDDEAADATLHDDHIAENRSEIRRLHRRLREGSIDTVIHRGFDLRGDVPDDLRILAVLERGKPYEVLVSPHGETLDLLEDDACVGVVHLRARAQVMEYRPELATELIRGDAGDWLTSLIDGQVDALVAPGAAIEQLGLHEQVSEIFPPEMLVPAAGAGVLLCLGRGDDEVTAARLQSMHDETTATEYAAECSLLEALGGPWEMPIGALARLSSDRLVVHAVVASPDGERVLREEHVSAPDDPCASGMEAAALLMARGAEDVLGGTFEDESDNEPCTIAGSLPTYDAEWEIEDDDDLDDDGELS
jgi:hydroxymethylbilane synthase